MSHSAFFESVAVPPQTQVCLLPLLTKVQQNLPTASYQHRELNNCGNLGRMGEPIQYSPAYQARRFAWRSVSSRTPDPR